jgi:alpha-N-acetylglucosaminidase
MALNGINMAYAQTAAEYPWIKVLLDLGLTRDEIDQFFVGPAYLAWFRMGNLKKFGGPLPQSWHDDQLGLQLKIVKRYNDLGINYVLPAFAGFVPDQISRLFPNHNFTKASNWSHFDCNFSW